MSNDTSRPPPELEYERPVGISRRGFRLLLLLTLINTILLGANLMGPRTWDAVRGAYVNWKNDRAKAVAAAKNRQVQAAIREKARVFRFPDGHVAYTEAPAEAVRYVSQALGYSPLPSNGAAPPGWQAPVAARVDPALRGGDRLGYEGQLFLHERKSPDGRSAFVAVVVGASFEFKNVHQSRNATDEVIYRLTKSRRLQAVALVPDEDTDELRTVQHFELSLALPDNELSEIARAVGARDGLPSATQPVAIKPGHQLRLFGGSPDPADASHFTIPYELDGEPGVIDGWLGNDSLVLRPRKGQPLASTAEPTWDLLAPTTSPSPPATRAAAPR